MKHGKKYNAAIAQVDREALLGVNEAVAKVKALATAKFDETIEIALNLGIDPRHADQMVRGMITLPSGTGKSVKVAVFARGPKAEEAKAAGADLVGAERRLAGLELHSLPHRISSFEIVAAEPPHPIVKVKAIKSGFAGMKPGVFSAVVGTDSKKAAP